MKKHLIPVLLVALGCIAFIATQIKKDSVSALTLTNVEALTQGENIYIKFCDDLCIERMGEVCPFITATGLHINCLNMERKTNSAHE